MGLLDTLVADAREALSKFTAPQKPTLGALPDASSQPIKDPHFFFGQPVTTGPYPMVVGTPQAIQDPNVGTAKPSRYVQVQNATGCVLKVQTGVGNFTIQGLAASTIPTDNQLPVTLNPTSGYTNFSEYVQIVWLLDGQTSPMADGSINAPYMPGVPLTITSSIDYTALSGGPTQLLAAPGAGTTYQLYNIVFGYVSGGESDIFVTLTNAATSYVILNYYNIAGGRVGPQNTPISIPISAPQQNGGIDISWTNTNVDETLTTTLNYFLVNTA